MVFDLQVLPLSEHYHQLCVALKFFATDNQNTVDSANTSILPYVRDCTLYKRASCTARTRAR